MNSHPNTTNSTDLLTFPDTWTKGKINPAKQIYLFHPPGSLLNGTPAFSVMITDLRKIFTSSNFFFFVSSSAMVTPECVDRWPFFLHKGNGCKVSRLLLQILFVKLKYFNYASSSNFQLRILMLRKQKFHNPTQRPCTHTHLEIFTKLLRCCGAYFV